MGVCQLALDPVLRAILSICILVFSAKVLGELFAKIKLPSVLGELSAGIILGPYALGSLVVFGSTLLEFNDVVSAFGEIGGILILFVAGLEMSFADFRHVGLTSFAVGTVGVILPFSSGYWITSLLGFDIVTSLVVGAALVATSIAVTSLVLTEIRQSNTVEAKVMISAAVVDDILGLAVLGLVVSYISTPRSLGFWDVVFVVGESLALFLVMIAVSTFVLPRFISITARGKSETTVEAAATASCFGAAALAAYIGLSPIVGGFAAGMSVASSKAIERIRIYISKISIIFSPVFFALTGAAFNLRSLATSDLSFYLFFVLLILIALASKFAACGLPAAVLLRNRQKGLKIGIGMMSRGEVGLIIAGIGLASGAITQSIYAAIVGMVVATTIVTPILLRRTYDNTGCLTSNENNADQMFNEFARD